MDIVTVTNENFEQEVLACKTPVVLDFWADWCMPCKMQSPILDAFAEEMGDSIRVAKVNVDEEAALALKYQIMSIPTLMVMKGGEITGQAMGVRPKHQILGLL